MDYTSLMTQLEIDAQKQNIPFKGEFELTSFCNLKCSFCYVSNNVQHSLAKNISTNEWLRIIEEAVNAGMMRANFTGGEVFVREDFEEIYSKTYDMGVKILILTNGTLIGNRQIEIFKKRPPESISMTLYGASTETYRKLTGVVSSFELAIKAIERMTKARLPLSLKAVAMPDILDEMDSVKNLAEKYKLRINLVKYFSDVRESYSADKLSWRLQPSKIQEIDLGFNNSNKPDNAEREFGTCNCAKGRFAITHDGRLLGCLSYTEIFTDPFADGFCSALEKLRKLISEKEKKCSDCASCSYIKECSKCMGLNYAETGAVSKCSQYRKDLAKYCFI